MNIKIIVNPRAGSGKAREIGYEVEKFLCERGIEYSLDSTYRPSGATSLAKKAVGDGFNLIIAVGGDGTINEVVNGMFGSSVSLAIIPAGNENNISKKMGLNSLNIREACEAAVNGRTTMIDVGKINDVYFLNSIGIGLSAEIAKQTSNRPSFIKGSAGSVLRLISVLRNFKPHKQRLKVEDVDVNSKVITTRVSNVKNGMFNICMLNDIGKLRLLYHLPKLFAQEQNNKYPFTVFRAPKLTIDCNSPVKAVYDGEILEGFSTYNIEIAGEKIPVKTK